MSVYLAWGTPPNIYSGPTGEPFLPGASGTVTERPPTPPTYQGVQAAARIMSTEGRVTARVAGYLTTPRDGKQRVFSSEIVSDADYDWDREVNALSEFFSVLVPDEDRICELYAYVDGRLLPKKLVAVMTRTSDLVFGSPRFYGAASWYEEDADSPGFWGNLVNATEAGL